MIIHVWIADREVHYIFSEAELDTTRVIYLQTSRLDLDSFGVTCQVRWNRTSQPQPVDEEFHRLKAGQSKKSV